MLKYKFIQYNGEPYESMTAEEWGECFNSMRSLVKPAKRRTMNAAKDVNTFFSDMCHAQITSDVLFERYSQFINDVLKTIRSGRVDYCFYIYQIADLLQYEHDRLVAEWIPRWQCFKVSLKDIT